MKKNEKEKQFAGLKRPTVVLTKEEHKRIAHFCIENDIKIGEFLKKAALYCVKKNIVPGEDNN